MNIKLAGACEKTKQPLLTKERERERERESNLGMSTCYFWKHFKFKALMPLNASTSSVQGFGTGLHIIPRSPMGIEAACCELNRQAVMAY